MKIVREIEFLLKKLRQKYHYRRVRNIIRGIEISFKKKERYVYIFIHDRMVLKYGLKYNVHILIEDGGRIAIDWYNFNKKREKALGIEKIKRECSND